MWYILYLIKLIRMRNNKYQSMHVQPCRNECSALLEFLLATMQVLKLSKIHFVEDSVFLDRPSLTS